MRPQYLAIGVLILIIIIALKTKRRSLGKFALFLGFITIGFGFLVLFSGSTFQFTKLNNIIEIKEFNIHQLLYPVILWSLGLGLIIVGKVSQTLAYIKNLSEKDPFANFNEKEKPGDDTTS